MHYTTENFGRQDNVFPYIIALVLLFVTTFYPLLFIGYTTYDDLNTLVNYGSQDIWKTTVNISQSQGRFTFLWGYPLLQVPYLFASKFWYLSTKIGAFLILMGGLSASVWQLFRSRWLVIATLALFLTLLQNGWDHNALTSYPFAFNAYASCFLFSLACFTKSIRENDSRWAWAAALLYFFAMGIELFVLFFLVFILVAVTHGPETFAPWRKLKQHRKALLTMCFSLMTYLVIYLLWRNSYPSNYDGNQLHGGDLSTIADVIWTYSINAFPFASIDFFLSARHQAYFSDAAGVGPILERLPAAALLKALTASAMVFALLQHGKFNPISRSQLLLGCLAAATAIFIPNVLLGVVEKHQVWVGGNVQSYLYTYYSFIAAVVFMALILAAVSNIKKQRLKQFMVVLLTFATLIFTFAVDARNQYIAFDQKLAQRKIDLVDHLLQRPEFQAIPAGSTLLIGSLINSRHGIAVATEQFWNWYFKKKTTKSLRLSPDTCNNEPLCYLLVFRQASHQDNQYLILSKLNDPISKTSSQLDVFLLPAINGMILSSTFTRQHQQPPEVRINGKLLQHVQETSFVQQLTHNLTLGHLQTVKIVGNIEINPNTLIISNFNFQP